MAVAPACAPACARHWWGRPQSGKWQGAADRHARAFLHRLHAAHISHLHSHVGLHRTWVLLTSPSPCGHLYPAGQYAATIVVVLLFGIISTGLKTLKSALTLAWTQQRTAAYGGAGSGRSSVSGGVIAGGGASLWLPSSAQARENAVKAAIIGEGGREGMGVLWDPLFCGCMLHGREAWRVGCRYIWGFEMNTCTS